MTPRAREWQRFTPRKRFLRFAVYLVSVAAVVYSVRTVEIIPEFLADAPHQMLDLISRMWPMDIGHYPGGVHQALIETLHVATLGTVGTVFMALPTAVLASHRVVPWRAVNTLARLILVSSRSVNTLVWALLFVAVFGPGAVAGTIAIAFRSIGFVGKLLSEALEETGGGPVEALRAVGAPWLTVFLKGYWPQVQPAFWSIILFRWDINVRESAVLGLVGAGGIGMALDTALNLFYWDRVALILAVIFSVVILVEILVTAIRKRIL
jgi:phosphonate transport system permease protein